MRILFVLILLMAAMITFAQNRNVIGVGAFYDNVLRDAKNSDKEVSAAFPKEIGLSVGYDRVIGKSVLIGVRYIKFTGTSGEEFKVSGEAADKVLKDVPAGYVFKSGSYTETGDGFSYESKIFFEDFNSDGPASFYLGVVYSRIWFKESITDITLKEKQAIIPKTMDWTNQSNKYILNRVGLKLGYMHNTNIGVEGYFGCYYNFADGKNANFVAPSDIAKVSLNIGVNYFLPF